MKIWPVILSCHSDLALTLFVSLNKLGLERHIDLAKFWQRAQPHAVCCLRLVVNLVQGAQGPVCYS